MQYVQLLEIELDNFKGVDHFSLTPEGEDCKIRGENATGKTTLLDAWLWLFTGQDSKGQSEFDIKPRKPEVQHHSNPTVRAIIEVEGEEREFSKTYKEVWKKPRGSTEEELRGHTKEYRIDDRKIEKQKEFQAEVEEIFDPERFLLLTDVRYFNDQLHWEERRKLLLDLIEGVDLEDVIEAEPELEDLKLDGLDPEEKRKQLKEKAKEIDSRMDEIPVQIKTLREEKPETDKDLDQLKAELEGLKSTKEKLEEEVADLKSSGKEAELRERKSEAKEALRELEADWKEGIREQIEELEEEIEEVKDDRASVETKISVKEKRLKEKEENIEELQEQIEDLEEEWYEIKGREFSLDPGELVCSHCGQSLSEELVENLPDSSIEKPDKNELERRRKKFNKKKAQDLEENEEKGKEKRGQIEELEGEIEELEEDLPELEEELENVESVLKELGEEKDGLKDKLDSEEELKEKDEYQDLQEELEEIEEELDSAEGSEFEKLNERKEQLEDLNNEIEATQEAIAGLKSWRGTLDRIEDLEAEEEQLASKYEIIQEQLRLIDLLTRTRANMLEDRINEKFDLVDFNLFRPYSSKEGLREVCETTVDGVSWDSTLNNGTKVKAGLDIIETLSEYYELEVPVWIDNAESITEIPEIETQQIYLIVAEGVEELEVEND